MSMIRFQFNAFADAVEFPIHLQYGYHEENDLYLHEHEDFAELVIVLDGSAQHVVNGESYPISKGDVFVIHHSTAHSFTEAAHLKICNIMFKPEIVFADLYDMKQLSGFQALFVLEPHYSQNHHFCSLLKLRTDAFSDTKMRIHEMMDAYKKKETGWKDLVYSYFRLLCMQLSKYYQVNASDSRNESVKLAGAAAYIENHFCSNISVAQLAQIAGYSERQFLRLFKAVFATTPNQYILSLRIRKAQQLLKNRDMTIGEAAWHCGYDDYNYFSRIFKKQTGMTPTEYQKLLLP